MWRVVLLVLCLARSSSSLVGHYHHHHPSPRVHRRATSTDDLVGALLDSSEDQLAALVETKFDAIDEKVLQQLLSDDRKEAAERAMKALRQAADARMLAARDLVEAVLDAGELLEMDRRLVSLFKDGVVDSAFLTVLNMNVAAARERATDEASEQRARVMEHLYTRAQEEWEKRLDDEANGLLHRLSRTEDPLIRRNILEYYLAPKTQIDVPNGDPVPLDPPQPPLIKSNDFAAAIDAAVAKLRKLDVDGDLIRASIEECRTIAKEARLVIRDRGSQAELRRFEEDLMATFPTP